jgi:RNA polymerase sigma factor (sigma-70 family)
MEERDWLALRFEDHRRHLQSVAYRMLGSSAEVDDALQEAWLRLDRTGGRDIVNLRGWLTTIVGRVCLDMLRSRRAKREDPLENRPVDPASGPEDGTDPEHETVLADSVGLALLVVLETLEPAERLAFVLHDLFSVPFDEIAAIVDRSPAAARQLASRARRRVQGADIGVERDSDRQQQVVQAFLGAARDGDFEGLLAVLDPDVVARSGDLPGVRQPTKPIVTRGAVTVARQAISFARLAGAAQPALVDGRPGLVASLPDNSLRVMAFTVVGGVITEMDAWSDPAQLAVMDMRVL